jgi:hypothetical protein
MIREDEADAKVIDAELDARDAAAEIPAAEVGAAQPWWETDRRFSDRFRALDDSD